MMTETEFDKRFTLTTGKDGSTVLEHEEVKDLDPKFVWTWVDGDDGGTYLLPGFHLVNQFGYAVTLQQWDEDIIEVLMDEPEESDEPERDVYWSGTGELVSDDSYIDYLNRH